MIRRVEQGTAKITHRCAGVGGLCPGASRRVGEGAEAVLVPANAVAVIDHQARRPGDDDHDAVHRSAFSTG